LKDFGTGSRPTGQISVYTWIIFLFCFDASRQKQGDEETKKSIWLDGRGESHLV
jgi:hypothetical protein